MGKSHKLSQAGRARRFPSLFSEVVCSQMVMYPEQASGRGAGCEGIQGEAGGWVVMDVVSFHYYSCFENPNCPHEIMNMIGFTAKGLVYKNNPY